ncbi:MAG: hypothetical protein HGB36_08465 [Chlorobiaceae bacterium]|nr:hypothetical protein [Chlorobiaceae bacterium]
MPKKIDPIKLHTVMQPIALPPLVWADGTVHQILVQPGERFYVFALRKSDGTTAFLRIADAHTGLPLNGVSTGNLVFDLMKEAYFRKLTVEIGYRDFGPDPQAGINKLCIDRVSLVQ